MTEPVLAGATKFFYSKAIKVLATTINGIVELFYKNLFYPVYSFILWAFCAFSCQVGDKAQVTPDQAKLEKYRSKFEEHHDKKPDSAVYYLELRKALINEGQNTIDSWQLAFDYSKHYLTSGDYTEAIDYCTKARKVAENMADSVKLAKVLNILGNIQHNLGNYARALDHFFLSLDIRKRAGNHSSTSIPLTNIGLVYKDMREYDKAGEAFKECLEIDKQAKDTFGLSLDYNHLGIVLKKAQKYDLAKENFLKSLALAGQLRDIFQKSIVLNNLGLVAAEVGNFGQAIKYLEEALAIKRELKMKGAIAETANYLAEVHMKNGDFTSARRLSGEALEISSEIGSKDQVRKAFQVLSGTSEASGDTREALEYYKNFKQYEDSMFNETRARQIAEMETIYESDKKGKQIAELTIARQQDALKRNRFVTALTIMLCLSLVFGLGMHYRNRKNKQITVARIKSYELTLDNFTQSLLEKNQQIEALNMDLEKARDEISNTCPSYTETINNLVQSTILTDDDWMKFKKLFLQVHPGFFNNLREKFPGITQTEERLIALTRLNLTTKEIASMLGISANSVNKSRYRLRKKLGISSDGIETLAAGF